MATATFAFTTTTTPRTTSHGLDHGNDKVVLSAEQWDVNDPGGALGKKSYNDGALFNFHMLTQAQKVRDYSAMDTYVDTNSLWNLAWHDSFVRNGLSDFVPPLTDSLNVLVVGNRYQGPTDGVVAVAGHGPSTKSSAAPIAAATTVNTAASGESSSPQNPSQDSSCSFLAAVFNDDSNKQEKSGSVLDLESYDCIMDQGLLADLCANTSGNKEDMARLLYEATKRIKDCGIYVASTPPLSSEAKEHLSNLGQSLGLQWVFDLDGISDENLTVSVARKYFKDELPPGWQSFWSRGLDTE